MELVVLRQPGYFDFVVIDPEERERMSLAGYAQRIGMRRADDGAWLEVGNGRIYVPGRAAAQRLADWVGCRLIG